MSELLLQSMRAAKEEQQARRFSSCADYGRISYTERWWKQGGVVFCQVGDEPAEATISRDLPVVHIKINAAQEAAGGEAE